MWDRRVTIREIAEEVGISNFSAHSIVVEDLAMKRVAAKFMPKLLTAEQEQLRVEVSQDMLDSTNSYPDFISTITLVMSPGCTGRKVVEKKRRKKHIRKCYRGLYQKK